ncbi:MAG: glycosyltransferase [Acidobacteria bacterium]|nr:glycosyltransferase [Acidobacteriota bacterium]
MNVSIVIPTWRGRHLLEAYLPSAIAASDYYQRKNGASTEIIIVEDAGGDDTVSWVRSNFGRRVTVIEHAENQGFCGACQTGFEHARFPLVLLLNNDVRIEQNCILPFVRHFEDAKVFAVTGKMFNQKGDMFCNGGKVGRFRRGMWTSYQNYDVLPPAELDSSYLSFAAIGAFSMYDRDKFLGIGGFEPLVSMYEDVEISYRAWKRGWVIKYEPRSVAYHDASQSMKRRFTRRSLDKLSLRSRILMHWLLLHDRSMFGMHAASMAGRLLAGWLWLDWPFYWAFVTGLKNIAEVRSKRDQNRKTAVRPDREVLRLLNKFYRTAPITKGP